MSVVDVIVWLGDLNYRLAAEVELSRVYEAIAAGQLAGLADWDQLNIEREAGRVFQK